MALLPMLLLFAIAALLLVGLNAGIALVWVVAAAAVLALVTPHEAGEERRWDRAAWATAACVTWALGVEVLSMLVFGLEATVMGAATEPRSFPEKTLDAVGWFAILALAGFGWRRALAGSGALWALGQLAAAGGFGFVGVVDLLLGVHHLNAPVSTGIVDLVDYRDGYCALLDSGAISCENHLHWPVPTSWPTDPEERTKALTSCDWAGDQVTCGEHSGLPGSFEQSFVAPGGARIVDVRLDHGGGCALTDAGTIWCWGTVHPPDRVDLGLDGVGWSADPDAWTMAVQRWGHSPVAVCVPHPVAGVACGGLGVDPVHLGTEPLVEVVGHEGQPFGRTAGGALDSLGDLFPGMTVIDLARLGRCEAE